LKVQFGTINVIEPKKLSFMKRQLYSLLILLISGVFLTINQPAKAQYIDYKNDSGWKLGLNVGGAWQQSDMKARAGIGFGATLGKALYQKEGRFFAFDLRFRYLRGWTYGYDLNRDTNFAATPVFNGSNSVNPELNRYENTTGFMHRNYKMDLHEYTLEGVLTLNRLRERTGIILYAFGGVGLTSYKVMTNQIDGLTNQAYDYSTLDSGNVNKGDLSTILDDTYETNALDVNGTAKDRKIAFMPSFGLGLGYQFTPNFAMGIEHKITFSMDDIIDGKISSVENHSNGTNDRYHYTALKFIWHLGKGNGSTTHHYHTDTTVTNINNYTNNTVTHTNTTTDPVVINKQLPIVNITNPNMSPAITHSAVFNVMANIYHVSSSGNVSFKVNGAPVYGFTFNPSTSQFNSTITLQPGNNVIELRGENKDGYDYQSVVINYDLPIITQPAPIITYINPPFSPYNTNNSTFNVTATILNIQGAQNITYKVNGVTSSNFSFNSTTKAFSSLIVLNPGNNVVEIKAVNSAGQDIETATLNYQVQTTSLLLPPVVTINNPTLTPYAVNLNSTSVDATVLNVASQNDITLKINGSVSYNFTYNISTKQMNIVANLVEGANIFEIKGTNAAGSDTKTTTIIYVKPAALPPLVTYTDPNINPVTVVTASKTVKATVLNVNSQNDIQVKFNGNTVTNFTYNISSKVLTYNANLISGANVMEIKATNNAGTDIKTTTIIYQKLNTNPPPVVTITYPASNPSTSTISDATIVGSVLNIAGASNITFTVNGVNNTGFSYNAATKIFTSNVTLVPGNNVFQITGTNPFGSDSESITIIYNEPCYQPVITMVQPGSTNFTTATSVANITAIVTNVTAQNNIQFKINGNSVPFTFNPASGTLNANVTLNNGANSVSITATNNCGNASSTTGITYVKPLVPPVVTITAPNVNPYSTTTATTTVNATILNVNSISGVSMKVNGVSVNNFTFNVSNQQFSSNVTLVQGNNIIEVTGTNTDGTDSKTEVIVYNPKPAPCNNPVVVISNPGSSVSATAVSSAAIAGTVQGITSASGLVLKVNGNISPVTYNMVSQSFSATFTLQEGANTIQVIATNACGTTTSAVTINYTRPLTPPVVTILNPGQNPFTSTQQSFTVTANIINIQNASQISYTVNGAANTNFSFNPSTNAFTSNITLANGNNTFTITATNSDGTDSESTVIVYENIVPPCNIPAVTVTNPATASTTVTTPGFAISISTLNVTTQNQIVLKKNGTQIPATLSGNTVTSSVTLTEGSNTFEIIATNDCGSANATFTVVYNRPLVPPVVTITSPVQNPYTSATQNTTVTASILNIQTASQISYTINGAASNNFSFNAATQTFSSAVSLPNGSNTFTITATNPDGSDSKSTVIIYQPAPCLPPAVTVNSPATANSTVSTPNLTISINTVNVTAQNQIELKRNGTVIPATLAQTNTVTATVTLVAGANTFEFNVNNGCGTATTNFTVNYTVPLQPPVVTITNPNTNPFTSANASVTIGATVQYVNSASNITYKVNGTPNTGFTYNPATDIFSAPATLNAGNNTIEITATNNDGTDSKSTVIVYNPPCNVPVVAITNPSAATATSATATYNFTGTAANVSGTGNILLTVNGTPVTFTFNQATSVISATLNLVSGQNTVSLNATNTCGKDNAATIIQYAPCLTPTVLITSPANGANLTTNSLQVSANVTSASQITASVNGSAVSGSFNSSTGVYSFTATLVNGANTISVSASTSCGNASATANVNATLATEPDECMPVVSAVFASNHLSATANSNKDLSNVVLKFFDGVHQKFDNLTGYTGTFSGTGANAGKCIVGVWIKSGCNASGDGPGYGEWVPNNSYNNSCGNPPVVTFTNPASNPFTTANASVTIDATVQNVTSASNINYKINGTTSSAFNYNASSDVFAGTVTLVSGNNTIEITATNAYGTDTKSTVIVYQPVAPPCADPVVTLSVPSGSNTTLSSPNLNLTVNTQNVSSQGQIVLKKNGTPVPATFNSSVNNVTASVTLSGGANVFELIATNDCGTASVSFTVNYNVPVPPPVVNITSPNTNPFTSLNASITIGATVENVNGSSDITFKINGTASTNFTYNATTDVLSAPVILVNGNTTVEIIATNTAGSDNASTVIAYSACSGSPAITVSSPSPINSTVTDNQLSVAAQLTNVFTQNEISFKLNGISKSFSYNTANGNFSGSLTLQQGLNTIEIYVNNACGKTDNVFTMTYTPNTGGNNQITICHYPPGNTGNPQTLTIPQNAWPAHLAHGDTLGACPVGKNKNVNIDPDLQKKLDAEKKKKEEEEAKKKAAEEELKRKAAEQEAVRKAQEEQKRKAAEEDAKRKAAEQEAIRKAQEEQKRKAAEEELKRKAAEQEAIRKVQEEQNRKAAEDAARKKAADDEIKRKAAEEAAKKKAAEEESVKKKVAEEAAKKKAADEAAKKKAEEEAAKKKVNPGSGVINKESNITVGEEGVD